MASKTRTYSNREVPVKRLLEMATLFEQSLQQVGCRDAVAKLKWGVFDIGFESTTVYDFEEYVQEVGRLNMTHLRHAYFTLDFNVELEGGGGRAFTGEINAHDNYFTIKLDDGKIAILEKLFESFESSFSDCERLTPDPEGEVAKSREAGIDKCVDVLLRFTDYQTRISRPLLNEKDVQEFMYPILKSHFTDLVEEIYLPPVAGASSKPDFGIPSLGLAIECKFLNKQSYSKIAEEIAVDLMRYFGSGSPYESLVVFVYDAAHVARPANFIADLESANEKIRKVIISPAVLPKESTESSRSKKREAFDKS